MLLLIIFRFCEGKLFYFCSNLFQILFTQSWLENLLNSSGINCWKSLEFSFKLCPRTNFYRIGSLIGMHLYLDFPAKNAINNDNSRYNVQFCHLMLLNTNNDILKRKTLPPVGSQTFDLSITRCVPYGCATTAVLTCFDHRYHSIHIEEELDEINCQPTYYWPKMKKWEVESFNKAKNNFVF